MTLASPTQQTIGNNLVFEDSIEVQAPLDEVYRRWTEFQRFPDFMKNVQVVRPIGGNRYHWVARIFGIKQEWDAEITDRELNRRVAWRSVDGVYNTGTVTFNGLGPDRTQIWLRLEYAPPGGKVGQALDKATQTTKREVHEDLDNFRKVITGKRLTGAAAQAVQQLQQQVPPGAGNIRGSLAVPIASSIAGGAAAYVIGKRLRESAAYKAYTSPVALPNAIAGWGLTGACAASVLGSASLRAQGRTTDALFVGQWAPTFLGFATLSRLIGHRGAQTNLPMSVTSWSYVAASLGSIASSAILHARGRREDGLFVGQWAPTLLGAALFTRLFSRMLTR